MNWLDIVIVVLIIIPTLVGLRTGIIKITLSLAGLIIGIILAGRYYAVLSEHLTFIPQENLARLIAFALILIAVILITEVLASMLKWIASTAMLGWINQLGGAIFGFALGAIFCGALLAIWAQSIGIKTPIAESSMASLLLNYFPIVLAFLPEEFGTIRSFFQ